MLQFSNGGRLCQATSELPCLSNAGRLYLDLETTSGDRKKTSLNPWAGCEILGVCVTADETPGAWYVPLRHRDVAWNLDPEQVLRWLADVTRACDEWVNHNIKYDAHVLERAGVEPPHPMVDTLTAAKLIDSDRVMRGGYSLRALSTDWLGQDISPLERRLKAHLAGSKDYGDAPGDIVGEYGCQDVITNRLLDLHIRAAMPGECQTVWETEVKLTSVLYDMELAGLRVDVQELQVAELKILRDLVEIEERLHGLTDTVMRPHVNADCFDFLCNQHGLPVLGWTEKDRNPSFDKDTLASYLRHPAVVESEALAEAIRLMLAYRKANTLLTFFVRPYQKLQVDGVLHPDYNQVVRTGRLSGKKPNPQQLSPEAKALIHPPPGWSFISCDYSQVEFRIIVHYIQDPYAIAAYAENPDTDFHQWVADLCSIPRKPAKNVNFAMGFGGGKGKIVMMLASNMELVGNLMERATNLAAQPPTAGTPVLTAEQWFGVLCKRRGEDVYQEYHKNLPGIKRLSRAAERKVLTRGFVRTAYGRRRHLPEVAAYRAFPSAVQGTAADIMKERTVATSPRFCETVQAAPAQQVASVHDETLFQAPAEVAADPAFLRFLVEELERTAVEFRVPIRTACGVAAGSWAEACSDGAVVDIARRAV